jgi:hypothetical protein
MTCAKFEQLMCDYIDGTLRLNDRNRLEAHSAACPSCAEVLADAQWTADFLHRVPAIEPPEELVTGILQGTAAIGGEILAPAGAAGGFATGGWWRPLLRPWVEPRFAMSMAMALLSLSMITYSGDRVLNSWKSQGTGPATIARDVQSRLDSAWARSVEIYEMIRASYQIESAGSENSPGGANQGSQDAPADSEQPK